MQTSNIAFAPELNEDYQFNRMKFKWICLKQDNVYFLHKKIININISYKLDTWSKYLNTDFTLGNCLFEDVKLTKCADPDKDKYNSRSQFSGTDGTM